MYDVCEYASRTHTPVVITATILVTRKETKKKERREKKKRSKMNVKKSPFLSGRSLFFLSSFVFHQSDLESEKKKH